MFSRPEEVTFPGREVPERGRLMKNVLRTLIGGGQVSLTLIDGTEMVREAIRLHVLSRASAIVLGKALVDMAFVSASLKDPDYAVSLSVRGDGEGGDVSVSGNGRLEMRGYIGDASVPLSEGESEEAGEARCLGSRGTFVLIRDDGYGEMPFTGTCMLPASGGVDGAFEEYYRVSEQIPTRVASALRFGENGELVFAGGAFLQPLPGADPALFDSLPSGEALRKIAAAIGEEGTEKCAIRFFSADSSAFDEREAAYKCNCSKEYLSGVLFTLGREELEEILRTDGEIKVHCHYCNKDYRFTPEDVKKMFP